MAPSPTAPLVSVQMMTDFLIVLAFHGHAISGWSLSNIPAGATPPGPHTPVGPLFGVQLWDTAPIPRATWRTGPTPVEALQLAAVALHLKPAPTPASLNAPAPPTPRTPPLPEAQS
jgi:hypothetical protein